jgi:hypothetical protein
LGATNPFHLCYTSVERRRCFHERNRHSAGKFLSAKLNDDGSVTYKMTKGQHKEVMEGIKESIEEALGEMIASEDYSFTKIEPNSDFTKFKVTRLPLN